MLKDDQQHRQHTNDIVRLTFCRLTQKFCVDSYDTDDTKSFSKVRSETTNKSYAYILSKTSLILYKTIYFIYLWYNGSDIEYLTCKQTIFSFNVCQPTTSEILPFCCWYQYLKWLLFWFNNTVKMKLYAILKHRDTINCGYYTAYYKKNLQKKLVWV